VAPDRLLTSPAEGLPTVYRFSIAVAKAIELGPYHKKVFLRTDNLSDESVMH
jgi:hypothetical protein